jgi:hypothetical protein
MIESLIQYYHDKEGQAGVNHTLSILRKKYWIVKGGSVVRGVVTKCIRCQTNFKLPVPPKMAPLPADRTAFEISGVDLFGPFKVKQGGRATHKRWVVLFTCFSTRAVHFEVVESLSAPVFKNALIRFNSRRPDLRRFYSDNGTIYESQ